MTVRKFLLLAPLAVSLLLMASFFWVPTYEEQTKGNPDRLVQFVTTSSGDAAMLNPILSADSASSQINGMVFEGLIDRDENLAFRGRVAQSWKLFEHAFFYVNAQATTVLWGDLTPSQLVQQLRKVISSDQPGWRHVRSVDLLPPKEAVQTAWIGKGESSKAISMEVDAPPRVRIVLDRVDPDLFDKLSQILGDHYFSTFDPSTHVTPELILPREVHNEKAQEVLPPTAHQPIIEFQLRKGVRFHDGHEVTSEDVKFTYEAIMDPKNLSPRIPDYEPVASVEVIDPLTVRITYKRLYSPAFSTWGMGILPAHLLNDEVLAKEAKTLGQDPDQFTMRQSRFSRQPIGCGPFVFQKWKSDQYIRLDRFDDYWEGPPNYKAYVMRVIPDPLTQEMEFYAGTIDDYNVQPHQVERLAADDRFQNFSGTAFGYTYIGYNLRRKPFNDVRVRRALGMAIDTQKIIDFLLYGQGEPITGPFVKQTDFYDRNIKPLPYDPEGAVALLEDAGWQRGNDGYLQKNGKRLAFTLITNNGNPLRKAVLAIAQDAWRKIGVQVETDLLEWSVFIQNRVNQLDFDALVLGWSMGIDPDLYQIWHSSQSGPYQLNFVGFTNPEADDLILKIRQEYDHERQVSLCHALHEIIAKEQPYTFLYVGRWTALLDKRIVRSIPRADGQPTIEPIVPTKTGGYTFHFNQWIKLNRPPVFSVEG
jgi:ABC-type transport system substrate-binding protein